MAAFLKRGSKFLCTSNGKSKVIYRLITKDVLKTESSTPIGFIGLGNMGAPMAHNLMRKGYKVVVNDVVPDAVSELKTHGAEVGDSPADIAARTNIVITMLPTSSNVTDVYLGKDGIMQTVGEGSLLIDSSTISPEVAKEVAAKAEENGATYLDAPVSGGVIASQNGTLSFLVGGSESGFNRAKPILECMGQNIFHCGGTSTGQAVKICNNMLLGISMIGTAEAINLGIKLGLDPKLLSEIINRSSGRCWSSDIYNPCPGVVETAPSSKNYQGGFGTALMTKDLGLAQDVATSTKSPAPLGSLAHQIYRVMCNRGYGHLDFSSVFKFLKEDE